MKKAAALLLCLLILSSCEGRDDYINTGINYIPYKEIPADYSLADAKADGLVVHENGDITSGQSVWDSFLSDTESGIPSMVRLGFYYTLDRRSVSQAYYDLFLSTNIC